MFVGDDASPEDHRSILSHFDDNFNIQYKRFGSNVAFPKNLRNSLSENIFQTSIVKTVGFKSFLLGRHSDDLGVLEFSIHGSSKIFYSNTAVVLLGLPI
ncbi:hypothetical protein [Autumnicola psychrophila]|uniref:Uncharacterized protein n=1 Tax=Autumnicola psychrophila TaxID=3075592 RepID=A0ABU3DT12_9FLAO|nr:hypothetical protein [Zunongwangia sp. F225]MDT0686850.1 hypothetical protein [Zunongwangia sp. F225]